MANNKKNQPMATALESRLLNPKVFAIFLGLVAFLLYYNTGFNYFSLDDNYINIENPVIAKGIAGIPEILTTPYGEDKTNSYGYRPIVRISYALEYQFTSDWKYNPYFSHFVNIFLYILSILLLYKVLRRLLKGYNIWFPFLVTLLFLAHPSHTEVVASLKNRDMLFNFIFTFLAILNFLKWADLSKMKYLIYGMVYFLLALLSKETAIAHLAVFPLVLYFFTELPVKKIGWFSLGALVVVLLAFLIPWAILPDVSRNLQFLENPLVRYPGVAGHMAFVLFILLWYVKMLFAPYPLAYYYGYDMIPMPGWDNPWVWVSLAIYLGLLVVAIKGFRKKKLLSFAILFYFISLSVYANVVSPVPGIVADRFMYFPSLSYAIILVWVLFALFRAKPMEQSLSTLKVSAIAGIILLIVIPYGYYTIVRNTQWKTKKTLYASDMEYLEESVKANDFYANRIMRAVNNELAKPVNPYKFIKKQIDRAEKHFRKALEIDSTHYASWNNLGVIYSKIHGNQALIRANSYRKQGKPEKVEEEEKLARECFDQAIGYFRKAQDSKIINGSAIFNIAYAYDLQQEYDSSIVYYEQVLEIDGPFQTGMSRLANAYFLSGNYDRAKTVNEQMMGLFPNSDLPYLNMGNYHLKFRDTLGAIPYYERAVERLTNPMVSKLLSDYYKDKGDEEKATYFMRKSYEAEKNYDPQAERD